MPVTTKPKRPPGRPLASTEHRSVVITLRVSQSEREHLDTQADKASQTLSEWMRERLGLVDVPEDS